MKEIEYIDYTVVVKVVTAKGLLCEIDGWEGWLPKSQIRGAEEVCAGLVIDIEVPKWLVEDKGMP